MKDFILFMYRDASDETIVNDGARWAGYLSTLRASGQFDGGSSIGSGALFKKGQADRPSTLPMDGFLRIRAEDLSGAKAFLVGNPVYEAGGTVEIRELPRDE